MSHKDAAVPPPAAADHAGGDTFSLGPGEAMAFHCVQGSDEAWTVVAGGPLELHLIHADGSYELRLLSIDRNAVEASTTTIEAGSLRAARLAPGGRRALFRRAAAPGHRTGVWDVPGAAEILRRHPLHRAIILDLTPG